MFLWLKKALKNIRETRKRRKVRGLCEANGEEHKSVTGRTRNSKKESKKMANEISKEDEVKSQNASNGETEPKKVETTEEVEKKTEEVEKPAEKQPEENAPSEDSGVVTEENPSVAKRVEDLVTHEEMQRALEAFEAKYKAVLKENEDLKNELSSLKDKYEKNDFGGLNKQGVAQRDKDAEEKFNDTFEAYAKQFM